MGKLELAILVGDESKKWLTNLTKQVDRLEELVGKLDTTGVGEATEALAEDLEDDDDDEEAPPKKNKKKHIEVDEDDDEDETDDSDDEKDSDESEEDSESQDEDDEESEEDEAPKSKKGKVKKMTADDCQDAAKGLAASIGGADGRAKVKELLKKKFKVTSVSDLKPEQYAKFVEVMEGAAE